MPDPIDLLIVTYDALPALRRCIQAVRENTRELPYRILVWDNGPSDSAWRWLARQRDVLAFRSSRNLGATRPFNRLFRHARSPFIVRLDDDSFVPPQWLPKILAPLEDPRVALVGCKYLSPTGEVQGAEILLPLYPKPVGPDGPGWRMTRPVDVVGSGCMAIRASVFRSLGGYWEHSSREDVDLCLRARTLGHRIIHVGSLGVTHLHLNRWRSFPSCHRAFARRWKDLSILPRRDSHEIERRYMNGCRAYERRKFRKAVAELQPLERLPWRDRGPQFLLGLACAQLGHWGKARQAIRGLVRYRTRLGLLAEAVWAMAEGAYSDGRRAVELGVERFPEESRFWFLRGELRRSKNGGRGRGDYLRALERIPVYPR